ncbi:hypothetical protein Alches_02610 [Alicyclobacillus hesperidum subsp. aegles]|uniref:hypothetical protein n=1 Tax=Alicyclobacillus hesperidum TaxID=89784 RepID=UPI0003032AA4|nr:hypothetical protein [Alicyclobacillus hesperidum]KRW91763.1 hypothetical protein SD51_07785 [Alicyclobacillus tengchongensis]GLG00222.1 hypothetical protein Alches_02610 [Alicyclobacillus hesperidum subsp. aegles]
MSWWSSAVKAFHQTNHDAVSVASGIAAAVTGGGKMASSINAARNAGVFDAVAIDGGAVAVGEVGVGVVSAAAPAAAGAAVAYAGDFVDHFGQNMGWWGN